MAISWGVIWGQWLIGTLGNRRSSGARRQHVEPGTYATLKGCQACPLTAKEPPPQVLRRGRSGPKGPLTEIPGREKSWKGFRPPCLLGRGSGTVRGSPKRPKKVQNCPGGVQKGSETVRKAPRNAQKLSGRTPTRLRNCPKGAVEENVQENPKRLRNYPGRAPKLSGSSPETKRLRNCLRNCPGGAQQDCPGMSPRKAQTLSGKSSKRRRNCPGGAF